MDLHVASRGAALGFALWTTVRVWKPPKNLLVSPEDDSGTQDAGKTGARHSGWELSLSPVAWKALFAVSFAIQTIFQVAVFMYWSNGWRGFTSARWTVSDVIALGLMGAAARLRRRAYKALGKYFTYKSVKFDPSIDKSNMT